MTGRKVRFDELAKAFASAQLTRGQVLKGIAASCLAGGSFSALGSKPARAQGVGTQSLKEKWSTITTLEGIFDSAYKFDRKIHSEGDDYHDTVNYSSHGTVELRLKGVEGGSGIRTYRGKGPRSGQYNETHDSTHADNDGGITCVYKYNESGTRSDLDGETSEWLQVDVNPSKGVYKISVWSDYSINTSWADSWECGDDSTSKNGSDEHWLDGNILQVGNNQELPLQGTTLNDSVQDGQIDDGGQSTATWNFAPEELLPHIPQIMGHFGWLNGAKFQERWFAGPAKVFGKDFQREIVSGPDKGKVPPDAPRDTTIKMESFVLKFPRAQEAYADLIEGRRWMNKNAKNDRRDALKEQ
jgi:hypothetical protein